MRPDCVVSIRRDFLTRHHGESTRSAEKFAILSALEQKAQASALKTGEADDGQTAGEPGSRLGDGSYFAVEEDVGHTESSDSVVAVEGDVTELTGSQPGVIGPEIYLVGPVATLGSAPVVNAERSRPSRGATVGKGDDAAAGPHVDDRVRRK